MKPTRLVVVSNRLPVVLKREGTGWGVTAGSGGLVTALGPVLRDRGGLWIGWPGIGREDAPPPEVVARLFAEQARSTGYTLKTVPLSREEIDLFYYGFSNKVLWPLFHDLFSECHFTPRYWECYRRVNRTFALAIGEQTTEDDFVWVHDYHLILVARELACLGVRRRCGFFLHIPFPPLDIFLKLPWRFQILDALLAYDLLGFQTVRDRRNFIGCVRLLRDHKVVRKGAVSTVLTSEKPIQVGSFPISIDFDEFSQMACSQAVAEQAWIIHANLPERQLILGIDRLDYTKGIPQRLLAYREALLRYPELRHRTSLIQVVIPSRRKVDEYEDLKQEIERLVGEINGEFTEVGWAPLQYRFGSLTRSELIAYYRTCEMALITPLKDGMNLIAKEYCACQVDAQGVLILSEFAGTAAQFHPGALLVNPYDVVGVAEAIHRAFHMDPEERRARMTRLRRNVARNDIYRWVDSFLSIAIEKRLNDFPRSEFYVPRD